MKIIPIVLLFAVLSVPAKAQGFFNQKGSRIKNLAKQIALFKTYTGWLQKGYSIAKDGWSTIGSIKGGDLRIHSDHFAALSHINPAIARYAKAFDILPLYAAIKKIAKPNNAVYRQLLEGCAADMDAFDQLLSAGQYQLSDAARLRRLQQLFLSMQDKYAFARYYAHDNAILSIQQAQASKDINSSRMLYAIKTP